MRRPTDLLFDLPDYQAFTAVRDCRERVLEDAAHQGRQIVRSGLRDVLDWLAEAGVHL